MRFLYHTAADVQCLTSRLLLNFAALRYPHSATVPTDILAGRSSNYDIIDGYWFNWRSDEHFKLTWLSSSNKLAKCCLSVSVCVCVCVCVSAWLLTRAEQIATAAHRDL